MNGAFLCIVCISQHLSGKVYLGGNTIHLSSVCRTSSTCVEVEKAMQSADLAQASKILIWNKRFMSFLGLWPCKVNQPLFVFLIVYMIIYCIMAAGHLMKNINQPERVVANLTDNVAFVMIMGKMFICRRSCEIMAKFLKSIEIDFSTEAYDNVREKMAYLYYNDIALVFIKYTTFLTGVSSIWYYFRRVLGNWNAICGYAGLDAFVLSMVLHVCGQFAALSCKIDNLLRDHENYHRHISNIILRHRHLIKLAGILEDNFNLICLQQTLGTVFLLCFTLYHMITTLEHAEKATVVSFLLYVCGVLSTYLAYCYISECLITESTRLRETFYNSDWYNNPPSRTKLISICMSQAEKPLTLTAGKFYMLSLNMFTNIVKTAMAYLSVLRQFM
ncbi:odorant receptor 13a-like isoform X2 [Temnothorax longispinosus]|uniref:odorant receptor 13a-like isoform X2 n=1 Tax=Temnothorax longispinosus TaxID=300112 RepID=UPI003A98EAE9